MDLHVQKRLAADVLGCSPKRVVFAADQLTKIKEAITRADVKGLVVSGLVWKKPVQGISRYHAKIRQQQRLQGRQKGAGTRKGSLNARSPRKSLWMNKIRLQRAFLRYLKEKEYITTPTYHEIYAKAKGGFFRSKRHVQLYLEERNLFVKKK